MAVSVRDLWVRYGSLEVLRGLDLAVGAGEVYLLMGPNGAGKTTLLRTLLGWVSPAGGVVEVDGLNPRAEPRAVRARVGFLPEVVQLYEELTVVQHLRLFGRLHRFVGDGGAVCRAAGIADDWLGRRVGRLSKGMRQRVALAILLTKDVTTLLLDEPTAGLDPNAAWDWARRVRSLADDRGLAVVVTSHQLEHWVSLADRVGVLVGGRMAVEFRPRQEGPRPLLEFWQTAGAQEIG